MAFYTNYINTSRQNAIDNDEKIVEQISWNLNSYLRNMMGVSNESYGPRGENTFDYEKGVDYRHFFYFYDSAKSFMKNQNSDRYHIRQLNLL